MRKILFIIISLMTTTHTYATPRKVEFWFFSPQVGMVQDLISPIKLGALVADAFNCSPMGDGCFHPQLGYINPAEEKKAPVEDVFVKPTIETNLIDCDKNYHFDLYCGEAKKVKNSGIEIWIDISTSMRRIAPSSAGNSCPQAEFIDRVQKQCNGKVQFSLFNTRLQGMSSPSGACSYYGLNNRRQLVEDIKNSNVMHLIVITDIDEYDEELRKFIDTEMFETKGLDRPMRIDSLSFLSDNMKNICKIY